MFLLSFLREQRGECSRRMLMSVTEIFLILGIEPVKDERLIKNAYREKLAVTNPEDDPEGFKRLRTAYEAACVYARTPDEKMEDDKAERDTTPSGIWLEKVAAIYKNIHSRQDEELWKTLFADEIFLSLEEEENCRWKLLRFMMDHFRLPTNIWMLLDKKLNLIADAARLRESFPADYIGYVVNRCERGEDLEFDTFEGDPEADYDLFINYYDDCWRAVAEENAKDAETILEEVEGLHIYHPAMEVCRGKLMLLQGKEEEAKAFMKALLEKHPKDIMVSYNVAELFWKCGDKDKAAETYLDLKEENEKHYMANLRLAEWYFETGEYQKAKKCAECVLSSGADDSFMELLAKINAQLEDRLRTRWQDEKDLEAGLELGWCYLQDGKPAKGIRLAEDLEKCMTAPKMREFMGLVTKLYIELAQYEEAERVSFRWEQKLEEQIPLDETEEEREKNQDRIRQAHMIRIQCYKMLGYKDKNYFTKAIEEINSQETGSSKDIGLLLEKAHIYMEMEEYEQCLDITDRLIQEYQVYAASATAIEAYRRQWEANGVVKNARLCIEKFPGYVRAYEHLAKVYLDLKETELLTELLELAKTNNIKSVYLEAYEYQMDHEVPEVEVLNQKLKEFEEKFESGLEEGNASYYNNGMAIFSEYMRWYPGPYLLRKRAGFHRLGGRFAKAIEDYEAALAEDPADAAAYAGLGYTYRLQGDFERALVCLRKALLYAKEDSKPWIYRQFAHIFMLMGDNVQAETWHRKRLETNESRKQIKHDLAVTLARMGRMFEAEKTIRELYSNNYEITDYNSYYNCLSVLYRLAGDHEKEQEMVKAWRQRLYLGTSTWFDRLFPVETFSDNAVAIKYFDKAGWCALVMGDGKQALKEFALEIKRCEKEEDDDRDGLEDYIFAAILYGEHETGRKYAEKLKAWLQRAEKRVCDEFLFMPKAKLTAEFLANYYEFSDEKLQEILDKEPGCAICDFCLMPICKELEAMRILLLIKQGKTKEAKARLARNLEVQPYDEYMQAIATVLK